TQFMRPSITEKQTRFCWRRVMHSSFSPRRLAAFGASPELAESSRGRFEMLCTILSRVIVIRSLVNLRVACFRTRSTNRSSSKCEVEVMKIIIPGGSGKVGTVLARALHKCGLEVVVLSRNPSTTPWRMAAWDGETLGDWTAEFEAADAIINLAGQ